MAAEYSCFSALVSNPCCSIGLSFGDEEKPFYDIGCRNDAASASDSALKRSHSQSADGATNDGPGDVKKPKVEGSRNISFCLSGFWTEAQNKESLK